MKTFFVLLASAIATAVAVPATSGARSAAFYPNHCNPSPDCTPELISDCTDAIAQIDRNSTFQGGASFTSGACNIAYGPTNLGNTSTVTGYEFSIVAAAVVAYCTPCGAIGTEGGCDNCRVTVTHV
ncbi:hypothetical protein EVG20_g7249 [Dentipellis fragilis]|uniref:Fungal calcium binding protein domain-containing protein n=1 Tax=Dentipellis fragilis TaxID=205917 RepID=A0A4Y9YEX7_9AGAM|nr:hypothetical protein EVG20_g7249 [Dentipellis fragilis]